MLNMSIRSMRKNIEFQARYTSNVSTLKQPAYVTDGSLVDVEIAESMQDKWKTFIAGTELYDAFKKHLEQQDAASLCANVSTTISVDSLAAYTYLEKAKNKALNKSKKVKRMRTGRRRK